ncbi:MAG: sigma-54 dependent transcriptional regulator [Planctomycetota bacterium]|jgi:two-component system response regulator HydG|nr:sigma-54-dependent Fis family transcriptional regulator [Planctomycetota bacterium]MDP6520462.1 sigma-54 dependent transcriptional regulator [Planctomycetota bacterium]MDP6837580.1 sigma-54 dependent transcriptional regulator [Planctomycetota bacterium]
MTDREQQGLRILVVDDDRDHAEALADGLEMDEHRCSVAHSGPAAVALLAEQTFDAVLTDLVMQDASGVEGLEVLAEARRLQPDAVVLLITGHASMDSAVAALRRGASDYLTKPVDLGELRTRLLRAVETVRLRQDNMELRRQIDKRFGFEGILGHSPAMQSVFDVLGRVASTQATVLVLGESGTGKELVARALHQNSPRVARHFVAVNCAAMSEGLIESELFGHVKGAFTGAASAKEGRLAYADGGTLFLDEVGDMPLSTQAKLLRVLETREVTPVGGNKTRSVDIRLVAATHRDLSAMVTAGTFREDLLFRLQVVTLALPPLRERAGDVPLLLEHFLREMAEQHGRPVRGITPEARTRLVRYDWPGNVRELRNAVENMVLLAAGEVLTEEDVPAAIREASGAPASPGPGQATLAGRSLAEVERDLIAANLSLMEGNREKTAKLLGIGERTLYRKIKEYGL